MVLHEGTWLLPQIMAIAVHLDHKNKVRLLANQLIFTTIAVLQDTQLSFVTCPAGF